MDHKNTYLYVKTMAEMASVSKAATALGVSQPALSAQIKRIEQTYGITLFNRALKPLTLTEAGEAYLAYCERQAQLTRDFKKRLTDITALATGELVIGGATLFNTVALAKTAARFSGKYPGVRLTITDGTIPVLTRRTLAGEIDFFTTSTLPDDPELTSAPLFDNRVLVAVPESYPVNDELESFALSEKAIRAGRFDGPQIDLKKLSGLSFIMLGANQNIGVLLRQLLDKAGVEPGRVITADQLLTSYALTQAGAGISLAPSSMASYYGTRGVVLYLAGGDACRRRLYVCRAKRGEPSAAAAAFTAMLEADLNHQRKDI